MDARRYRLVIEGVLADEFDGLTTTVEDGNTVLTGVVRDSEHLMAVLGRILALDATLLSLQALD